MEALRRGTTGSRTVPGVASKLPAQIFGTVNLSGDNITWESSLTDVSLAKRFKGTTLSYLRPQVHFLHLNAPN